MATSLLCSGLFTWFRCCFYFRFLKLEFHLINLWVIYGDAHGSSSGREGCWLEWKIIAFVWLIRTFAFFCTFTGVLGFVLMADFSNFFFASAFLTTVFLASLTSFLETSNFLAIAFLVFSSVFFVIFAFTSDVLRFLAFGLSASSLDLGCLAFSRADFFALFRWKRPFSDGPAHGERKQLGMHGIN